MQPAPFCEVDVKETIDLTEDEKIFRRLLQVLRHFGPDTHFCVYGEGARFGFNLDENLKTVAADEKVKTAIADNLSRELISHEIDLMISYNNQVKAMTFVCELNPFSAVFTLAKNTQPTPTEESERICVLYIQAAWKILHMMASSLLSVVGAGTAATASSLSILLSHLLAATSSVRERRHHHLLIFKRASPLPRGRLTKSHQVFFFFFHLLDDGKLHIRQPHPDASCEMCNARIPYSIIDLEPNKVPYLIISFLSPTLSSATTSCVRKKEPDVPQADWKCPEEEANWDAIVPTLIDKSTRRGSCRPTKR